MKAILLSNMLEHECFPSFLRYTASLHPEAIFVVMGDLLNIFPEPGEDLRGSIFYEIYGDMIFKAMDDLVDTRFQFVKESPFVEKLYEMFSPTGKYFEQATSIAKLRYENFFTNITLALQKTGNKLKFLFIPGNMDYPFLSAVTVANNSLFLQLDNAIFECDGVKIGGLGGNPNTAHPFRGIVEISPYEMHELEYERRLNLLSGVDVLLTHLSPFEFRPLHDFLKNSVVQLSICRAPFNFTRYADFRGELKLQKEAEKSVIMVRPFDYPKHKYFIIDIKEGCLNPPDITEHYWQA